MVLSGRLIAAPDSDVLLNVLRSNHYTKLAHVADLPLPVLRACVNDPTQVAEPGGPFNPTDAADARPGTRLVWAAASSDGTHYVAQFEYGGIGYHRTILLLAFDTSNAMARVLGIAEEVDASGIDELIAAAAASKTPFWHELGRYH